jgi:hypothetical protein
MLYIYMTLETWEMGVEVWLQRWFKPSLMIGKPTAK